MTDDDAPPPAPPSAGDVTDPALRECKALMALTSVVARFESMLESLEARPCGEAPLDAFAALVESDEGQVLTVGPDEQLVLELLGKSPSLAGRFLWKSQEVIDRLAADFARREGVPHTDLRPQLLAAGVVATLRAALRCWLSSPSGPSLEELTQRGLAQLAEGFRAEDEHESSRTRPDSADAE